MLRRMLSLIAVFAVCVAAQPTVGSISGIVTDSSGSAVPGCLVSANNTQTGQKVSVRTQETGLYVFASLSTGVYSLTAEKEGFRVSERSGVILDATSRRTVDFALRSAP
jgi:hypothetical protein